jgi:hypothetical protein
MSNERFTVSWLDMSLAPEYIVSTSHNGDNMDTFTVDESTIELSAPEKGGNFTVSVKSHHSVGIKNNETQYVDSESLVLDIGVYNEEAVNNFLDYYYVKASGFIEQGIIDTSWERDEIKSGFFDTVGSIVKGDWMDATFNLLGMGWEDCQNRLLDLSEEASMKSLTCSQYFCEWYDAIKSGSEILNGAVVDQMAAYAVGALAYAQASIDYCSIVDEDYVKSGVYKGISGAVEGIENARNYVSVINDYASGGIKGAIQGWYSTDPLGIIVSSALAVGDTIAAQNAFQEITGGILQNFNDNCRQLASAFRSELQS